MIKIKDTIKSIAFYAFMIALIPTLKYPTHLITTLYHKEKLDLKNDILDDVVKAYKENEISKLNNVAVACGYFTCALKSGTISINNNYGYSSNALYDYNYENDYDCILGKGVCRNENLLLSNLLSRAGFDTTCLVNYMDDGNGHLYILIFDEKNNKKFIYDYTNTCFWKFNSVSETETVKRYGNNNSKSENYVLASLAGIIDFDYSDLIKINSYDNDVDFKKLYEDYLDGIRLFTHIDQERINNLTIEAKEKIKKLEQK